MKRVEADGPTKRAYQLYTSNRMAAQIGMTMPRLRSLSRAMKSQA